MVCGSNPQNLYGEVDSCLLMHYVQLTVPNLDHLVFTGFICPYNYLLRYNLYNVPKAILSTDKSQLGDSKPELGKLVVACY